jgi:hypothetical protein
MLKENPWMDFMIINVSIYHKKVKDACQAYLLEFLII